MKALWSRTGLSHRCGCRACDQVVQAGRQTTRSAAVRGRKPNYANRVAFYSSMLCTATIVDTVRKDQRSHEIDDEIQRIAEEVEELRARRKERQSQIDYARRHFRRTRTTPCDASEEQNEIIWEHMERMYVNLPSSKEFRWAPKLVPSKMVDDLRRKHYGVVDDSPDEWAHTRAQIDRILEEIKAEEIDPHILQREPIVNAQYRMKRSSVLNMILSILGGAERLRMLRFLNVDMQVIKEGGAEYNATRRWLTDTVGAGWELNPISWSAQKAYRQRTTLAISSGLVESEVPMTEETPALDGAWEAWASADTNWSLDRWDPVEARQNTVALNTYIRKLFAEDTVPLDETLGRICRNLMLSPFLPDIHTFNLLMAEFAKRREHKLYLAVLREFQVSRMRSTPASLSMTLLGPAMFSANWGLKRAIAAIVGWESKRGAKVARTQVLAMDLEGRREYLQAMSPVYMPMRDSIITSLLAFHLFESAAAMFLACVRAEVKIGWHIIQRVFEAHIEALDWQGAMLLIRGICWLNHEFWAMLDTLSAEDATATCRHLHSLLDFCGLHFTPWGGVTLSEKVLEGRGLDLGRLRDLAQTMKQYGVDVTIPRGADSGTEEEVALGSRVLQLESIDKELLRVRRTLYSIEAGVLHVRLGTWEGQDSAVFFGRSHVKKAMDLNNEFLAMYSHSEADPDIKSLLEDCCQASARDETWLRERGNLDFTAVHNPDKPWTRKVRRVPYAKQGYFAVDDIRMSGRPRNKRLRYDFPVNRIEGWRPKPRITWIPHAGSSIQAVARLKANEDAFAAEVEASLWQSTGREGEPPTLATSTAPLSKKVKRKRTRQPVETSNDAEHSPITAGTGSEWPTGCPHDEGQTAARMQSNGNRFAHESKTSHWRHVGTEESSARLARRKAATPKKAKQKRSRQPMETSEYAEKDPVTAGLEAGRRTTSPAQRAQVAEKEPITAGLKTGRRTTSPAQRAQVAEKDPITAGLEAGRRTTSPAQEAQPAGNRFAAAAA